MQLTTKCPPEICNAYSILPWCANNCQYAKESAAKAKEIISESKPKFKKIVAARGGYTPQKVLCIDTKTTYESVRHAAHEMGVSPDAIMNCARGDTRTCKGMKWQYVGKDRKTPPPAPTKEQMAERYKRRKVKYIPTGKVYDSAEKAATDTGYGLSTVYTHAPRGEQEGKPKYFEYVED